MKNLKITTKFLIGFGILIIFSGLNAFFGRWGVDLEFKNTELADNANQLLVHALDMRRQEKNFFIRGFEIPKGETKNAWEHQQDLFNLAFVQIDLILEKDLSAADEALIIDVSKDLNAYYSAFETYVNLESQKIDLEVVMVEAARQVLDVTEEMRSDQKDKLYSEIANGASVEDIHDRLLKADDTNRLIKWMLEIRRDEKNFILRNDPVYVENITGYTQQMTELLTSMKIRFNDAVNDQQADTIQASLDAYYQAFTNYEQAVVQQKAQEVILIDSSWLVQDAVSVLRDSTQAEMLSIVNTIHHALNLVMVIAIGSGILIAILFSRNITNSVKDLLYASRKIAVGEVDVQINVNQKDEMGQLADAFRSMIEYIKDLAGTAYQLSRNNLSVEIQPKSGQDVLGVAFQKMTTNLRTAITEISGNALLLNTASDQLSDASTQAGLATGQIAATIQQIALGTSQQAEASGKTTSSVSDLTHAIDGVAKGAQEQAISINRISEMTNQISESTQFVKKNIEMVTNQADEASKLSRDGSKQVEATIIGMQSIQDKVNQSANAVKEMGQRSEKIGIIVETIEDIASQTNLLALNAAIEAARAGEHGKGFAVVADEVRQLAERSSKATREIAELVKGIQQTIITAVAAMEESGSEVEKGVAMAGDAGIALDRILTASESVREQAGEVDIAAVRMSEAANELVMSMDAVSAVVEENTAATEEMTAGFGQVSEAFENIASVSEENSASVEEVSASTEEMAAQVQQVVASVQEFARVSQNLAGLVTNFNLGSVSGLEQIIRLSTNAHLKWVERLESMVAGNLYLDEDEIGDHHSCILGKWCDGTGQSNFEEMADFQDLCQTHQQFHILVKKSVVEYNKGNQRKAIEIAGEVNLLSNQIIKDLDDLVVMASKGV
jgi:methyl-accepting chemotaxis protein